MPDTEPTEEIVAPAGALALLARHLLADLSDTAPDLAGAVVVLPNLHAASALARALNAEAGCALILPKTTTLGLWAAEQALPAGRLAGVVREAALFGALRSRKWFEAPDLWPLTGELADLFDELTRYSIDLPETVHEFEQALETAYQAKAGEAMQFEARLVHELWRATSQADGGELDPVAIYQLQLAHIARAASRPLYAIGLPVLTPAEHAFLKLYASRVRVRTYRTDGSVRGASLSARFYAHAWPPAVDSDNVLHARAAAFAAGCPTSPVVGNLRLYGAASLEQEASAVDTQVRLWLTEGRKRIAVVALDRLVARRSRALLERARVMVDDETGWIFSTTSASTILMRWLDVVSSGFYYQDLLDLIKSPFIFSGWEQRREAAFELERVVRAKSVVAGLDNYRSAVHGHDGNESVLASELLDRLARAARILRRDRRRRLHEWLSQLFGSLASLGVEDGLRRDPAGLQLVEYLQRRSRELEGSDEVFSFGEWRQWLNRQLESAEFRDSGISSPVIFTQLSLTRLREFDAVVLTGCDASHLPGTNPGTAFFNQSVRTQLGLATTEHRLEQIRDDLIGLLSRSSDTLVTWQQFRNGEQNLLSPMFERIEVFHGLAWGRELADKELGRMLPGAQVVAPVEAQLPPVTTRPAPAIGPDRAPGRISASGYNSLVACPYQFYARYVLGLREPDEVREELEKRDYGEYVHQILHQFHRRFPVCREVSGEQLDLELRNISESVFKAATEASYLSHAWALRWQAIVPAYLDWQLAREEQGWRFHAAENKRDIEIRLADGTLLTVEGRIDRVDTRAESGRAVLSVVDYKTRAYDALRSTIREPGEDVQLPVYAALLSGEVQEALFLSLDGGHARSVRLDSQTLEEAERSIERLRDIFSRMREGAPLPAQGVDAVCLWCEMQGLCRKAYWV
jgi:ATP-dependent helicase/nuclease subunit B